MVYSSSRPMSRPSSPVHADFFSWLGTWPEQPPTPEPIPIPRIPTPPPFNIPVSPHFRTPKPLMPETITVYFHDHSGNLVHQQATWDSSYPDDRYYDLDVDPVYPPAPAVQPCEAPHFDPSKHQNIPAANAKVDITSLLVKGVHRSDNLGLFIPNSDGTLTYKKGNNYVIHPLFSCKPNMPQEWHTIM